MTVAVPFEAFEIAEPWAAKTIGMLFSTSSTRVAPVDSISLALTEEIGLIDASLAVRRREPVTTTSSSFSAAGAGAA